MSRFREELRVIPPLTWPIAVVVYLCSATLLFEFALPGDVNTGKWPVEGRFLFAYGIFLLLFLYVLVVGYICGDSKRRGMNCVLWTLIAILVPNTIGIILYFVLRDPVPRPCPSCATPVKSGVFCPHCGTALQATCPSCRRGVEPAWTHCPHCGSKLSSPAPRAT
jgi:hypothetical protein